MILTLALLLATAEVPVDAERSAWRYKRTVTVSNDAALVSLTLPPDLSTQAGAYGRDLRLVDETGRETPFILDWTSEREGLETWQTEIKDIRREKETPARDSARISQWTVDLKRERTFSEMGVQVPDVEFAWHVRVETSFDGRIFRVADDDASLFDQVWNDEHVRKTTIVFDTPITARYIRMTARSAADSSLLELIGASVTLRRRLRSDNWALVAPAKLQVDAPKAALGTRYRLDASSLLPFDEVEVNTDDAAFSRSARLVEVTDTNGRKTETVLGQGKIFRLRSGEAFSTGQSLTFGTRSGSGGALVLEIDDRGSPPLRSLKVTLRGSKVRLLFPSSGKSLTLYYGNSGTRSVAYDLESLRHELIQAIGQQAAALGPEEANPLFSREPPLRFKATFGATLDATGWRHERALSPIQEEDVYSTTLKAQDLAVLRPDFADLRLVDSENRQVPFLIDRDFAEERVPLEVQKLATAAPKQTRALLTPSTGTFIENGQSPSLSRIELEIEDPYFERSARIVDPERDSRRNEGVSVVLSRRPPSMLPLAFGATMPLRPIVLEIDDGDNAPLNLQGATAIVRVPRVVFKGAPGNVRMLLGNPSAEPPRYDIAGLRTELLAYSSVTLREGALAKNEQVKETLASRFAFAPRGVLVWAAIAIAIVALVALTIRTIKSV